MGPFHCCGCAGGGGGTTEVTMSPLPSRHVFVCARRSGPPSRSCVPHTCAPPCCPGGGAYPPSRAAAGAGRTPHRAQSAHSRHMDVSFFMATFLLDGSMRMFFPGLTLAVAAKLVYEKWQERRAGEKNTAASSRRDEGKKHGGKSQGGVVAKKSLGLCGKIC